MQVTRCLICMRKMLTNSNLIHFVKYLFLYIFPKYKSHVPPFVVVPLCFWLTRFKRMADWAIRLVFVPSPASDAPSL